MRESGNVVQLTRSLKRKHLPMPITTLSRRPDIPLSGIVCFVCRVRPGRRALPATARFGERRMLFVYQALRQTPASIYAFLLQ